MANKKLGKSNLGNVMCHFCKGVKLKKDCRVVKVKGGGRAYKCKTCREDDKKF